MRSFHVHHHVTLFLVGLPESGRGTFSGIEEDDEEGGADVSIGEAEEAEIVDETADEGGGEGANAEEEVLPVKV